MLKDKLEWDLSCDITYFHEEATSLSLLIKMLKLGQN